MDDPRIALDALSYLIVIATLLDTELVVPIARSIVPAPASDFGSNKLTWSRPGEFGVGPAKVTGRAN
jgi:hypothetical protein